MSNYKAGYLGYRKYSEGPNRSSSIYCISDENSGELDIIILTIGTFADVYRLIKEAYCKYSKIRILPISIQYDYISDIYNIVTCAQNLYKNINITVEWVFPTSAPYYSEEFDMGLFKTESFHNEADPSISFSFVESGVTGLYDIIVYTPLTTKYFTLYCTEDKLLNLLEDTSINEIHMSGAASRHGGICGLSLPVKSEKIRLFNFETREELAHLSQLHHIGFVEERWS